MEQASPPPSPLQPLTGGCLCGRTRYEARPEHRDGYYCHCRMCQLAFGNTRVAWFNLRKDQLTWLTEPKYYASSKMARRSFCGHCGTPLSFEFHESERMDVSVGSLDDPNQLTPVEHWSIESKLPRWEVDDGLPGHRLDANETINKRWQAAYGPDVRPGIEAVRKES